MKTTWKFFGGFMISLSLVAVAIFSCTKDHSASVPKGQQNVSLYLSDDPALFDKVLIDVESVRVLVDTTEKDSLGVQDEHHENGGGDDNHHDYDNEHENEGVAVWENLNIRPGIYDLLTLRNGADTLFASGNIPKGEIKRIKIKLGPNNSLVKDSVSYPLHLLPQDSTITLKLNGDEFEEYLSGHFRLWLDFNIGRSIFVWNGQFYLRPYIHMFIVRATGSVAGIVVPGDAFPVVSVFNATDTAYAIPEDEGYFKVRGLNPGTYTVFVNTSNGYKDTTISNVSVTVGQETNIGKITLHK